MWISHRTLLPPVLPEGAGWERKHRRGGEKLRKLINFLGWSNNRAPQALSASLPQHWRACLFADIIGVMRKSVPVGCGHRPLNNCGDEQIQALQGLLETLICPVLSHWIVFPKSCEEHLILLRDQRVPGLRGWGVEGLAYARGGQVQPQSSFPDLMFGHDCLTLVPLSQEYVSELLKGCVSSLYLYHGIRQKDSLIEWWRKPRHVFLVAKSHSQLPEIAPSLPPFCWCITS